MSLQLKIYHLVHPLERPVPGFEPQIRCLYFQSVIVSLQSNSRGITYPVVAEVFGICATCARRLFRWIVRPRRHGSIERITADNLMQMDRRSLTGLNKRVDSVDNQLITLKAKHSSCCVLTCHEAVGGSSNGIVGREEEPEGDSGPLHLVDEKE